ncbi:MAG TPA: MFS transporter [Streptosporangiaceae bacterium]|nr:MFS transporter [Streptosporangiaceae bacterium]
MRTLKRKWWTLIVVCTGIFMLLLDITIVNIALPDLVSSLHASFSDLEWVIDAYAISLATLLLIAGSLGDLAGARKVFLAGLAIFCTSSLLCGVAQAPGFLIASGPCRASAGRRCSPPRWLCWRTSSAAGTAAWR